MLNRSASSQRVKAVFLLVIAMVTGAACSQFERLAGKPDREPVPMRLYVVSDVHVGNNDTGENMMAFARMVNRNRPDVVLDLGDTFQAEVSDQYPVDTHEEAARQQHRDWLAAWNHIEIEHKALALGNRDIHPAVRTDRFTLNEELWVENLGYESNPVRGGTRLQTSFIAEGGDVTALIFTFCSYLDSFSMEETMDWVREEVTGFDGDVIIFSNHHVGVYEDIRKVLVENTVSTPVIYLHGHNHGPDTIVRDAWGLEQDNFVFPAYLITDLMENGIGVKFKFYPDGRYEIYRLDVNNNTISSPVMHYQTRVESE